MTRIPQYASSTDPNVIAVVERNRAARREVLHEADAFARKYAPDGDGGFFISDNWGTGWSLSAIASPTKPTAGQWKQVPRRNAWLPYKNNPIHDEMTAIRRTREAIPGLAQSYAGDYNRDGSQAVYFPSVFVHDGVAYMSMPGVPIADQKDGAFGSTEFDEDRWTEILTSHWYAAKEAAEAQSKAEVSR